MPSTNGALRGRASLSCSWRLLATIMNIIFFKKKQYNLKYNKTTNYSDSLKIIIKLKFIIEIKIIYYLYVDRFFVETRKDVR